MLILASYVEGINMKAGWLSVIGGALLVAGGCAKLGNGRVDLPGGAGIEVETLAAAVAAAGQPAVATAIRAGEVQLAGVMGKTPAGPFGALPYRTQRDVVLKNGQRIGQEEIAQIVETLTPVVPDPIVRVVAPEDLRLVPVATNAPAVQE